VGGIIVIGGSKGGNGKTLLATLLAPGLAQRGYRTGVIDADPNAVFSAWHATYTGPALRCQAESRDVQVVDLAQAWAEEIASCRQRVERLRRTQFSFRPQLTLPDHVHQFNACKRHVS
jgi:tetraacyldisaccharide-1-P 4'-kinase